MRAVTIAPWKNILTDTVFFSGIKRCFTAFDRLDPHHIAARLHCSIPQQDIKGTLYTDT